MKSLVVGLASALVVSASSAPSATHGFAGSQAVAHPRMLETPDGEKPRVVITADPELDDLNSLIRFLLYSSDVRVEGLIYASSQFHWKGDGRGTLAVPDGREYRRLQQKPCPCPSWRWGPDEKFIDDAVTAYSSAYPNLRRHHRGYPSPNLLRSKIRWGNVAFDGEMRVDTPGSNLIKRLLLDEEESPIYLHAWGGQSTIARALKSIEEEYRARPNWARIRAKVVRKAIIHPSGDQDDTYTNYIKPNWPEIRYRQNKGGVDLGYTAPLLSSLGDIVYFSTEWTKAHVSSRGPFGALYRVWGDGKQMVPGDKFDYFGFTGKTSAQLRAEGFNVWIPPQPAGSFIGEGDTPTFLNLIDNGLRGYRGESYGGWGGYHDPSPPDGRMRNPPNYSTSPARAPTHPFLANLQRDFAARLIWSVTPRRAAANHHPLIRLQGRFRVARPGERVSLDASARDPDGDKVRVRWWRWDEADSASGSVTIQEHGDGKASFEVPREMKAGQQIHLIAEAQDSGTPALTRYDRVVVTIG